MWVRTRKPPKSNKVPVGNKVPIGNKLYWEEEVPLQWLPFTDAPQGKSPGSALLTELQR